MTQEQCRPLVAPTVKGKRTEPQLNTSMKLQLLNSLRLVPRRHVRQLHHVTFSRDVPQDVLSGLERLLAAVAAALVDLTPDEVHQFDLLVEAQV